MKIILKTGVSLTVIVVHVLILALMSFQHTPKMLSQLHQLHQLQVKKIAVQTVKLSPNKRSTRTAVSQPAPKPVNIPPPEPVNQNQASHNPQPLESPKETTPSEPLPSPQTAPKPDPKPATETKAESEPIKDRPKETNPKSIPQPAPKKESKPQPNKQPAKKTPTTPGKQQSQSPPSSTPANKAKAAPSQPIKPSAEQRQREERLLRARQSLANIDKNSDKTKSSGNVQKGQSANKVTTAQPLTQHLHIDREINLSAEGGEGESSGAEEYRSEIAQRLRLMLRLPEYGDVKVKLTLNRFGRVMRVSVIQSENAKNRDYVVNALKEMSFPGFGIHFNGEPEHTFILTLSNDI